MLIQEQKIDIKVTNKTESYFQELGYNVKNGDKIQISIEQLSKGKRYY